METPEDVPLWAKVGGTVGALLLLALLLLGGVRVTSGFFAFSLGSPIDLARYASVGLWPAHPGYVEKWGIKNQGGGVYTAWAEYLYEVDGDVYRGWRLTVGEAHHRSEDSARNALLPFPVGQVRNLAVNPLDASDAVLERTVSGWGPLLLRLTLTCLTLGLVGAILISFGVRRFAVALAMLALLSLGAFCRSQADTGRGRRESLDPAGLRQRLAAVQQRRKAWTGMKKGDLASTLAVLGEPDRVVTTPEGGQTWYYDLDAGMEGPGKIQLLPSTRGLVVERVFSAYSTSL